MRNTFLIIAVLLSITIYSQEDKTVTLTVSGTGKTLEEAKTNALRSAIEQAFGAFISSKTEILNDDLVKDEIVSVANGNVQKYDIVSQVEVPNIGYAITLSATVSILKLTSFAESKGVVVEFKGGMFAQNIKLQKLNEQSEEKAIKNLIDVYTQILESSFDYKLITSEPVLVEGQSDMYNVNFSVNTVANTNFNNFIKYLTETLDKVQAIDDEAANIIKVGKPLYYLIIDNKICKLRSINSYRYISKFFIASQLLSTSFKITSNVGTYKYSFKNLYGYSGLKNSQKLLNTIIIKNKKSDDYSGIDLKDFTNGKFIEFKIENYDEEVSGNLGTLYSVFIDNNTKYNNLYDLYEVQMTYTDFEKGGKKQKYIYPYNQTRYIYRSYNTLYFITKFNEPTYTYAKTLKLSELEKITSFKIDKVPFLEYINNLSNYVELEK